MTSDPDTRVYPFLGRVLDERGQPAGTCFQVSPGVLVTAWHVLHDVDAAAPGAITRVDPLAGGRWFAAVVAVVDERLDLAVLRGDVPLAGSVPGLVPTDAVALRAELEITGVSRVQDRHDYRFITTTGIWQGPVIRDEQVRLGRLSADSIMPGMSGAPVLRAGDQMVLGVLSGRYNSTNGWLEHTGWVTRTETLITMLDGIAVLRIERAPRMSGPGIQAQPNRLTVSARGNAAFTTMAAAIAAASPGERITVLPGVYHECIELDVPVVIVGKGRRSEIILSSDSGPCIKSGGGGLMKGISLRLSGLEKSPYDYYSTIEIVGGKFKLSDCEITGGRMAGIQVDHGAVTIDRCRIRSMASEGTGLLVLDGTAKARQCQLNGFYVGAEIRHGSCELASCEFKDCRTGVFIAEYGSRATMTDCVIRGGEWGVEISHGHIIMRQCRVNENRCDGVNVYEEVTGEFADNDFSGNREGDFHSKTPKRALLFSGNTGKAVWEDPD